MNNDSVFVGVLPDGRTVYATSGLIAQRGMETVRYELVDRHWFAQYGHAPGYYEVRVSLRADDTVKVRATSREDAVRKVLAARAKKDAER